MLHLMQAHVSSVVLLHHVPRWLSSCCGKGVHVDLQAYFRASELSCRGAQQRSFKSAVGCSLQNARHSQPCHKQNLCLAYKRCDIPRQNNSASNDLQPPGLPMTLQAKGGEDKRYCSLAAYRTVHSYALKTQHKHASDLKWLQSGS